ncbi:MAG TPA: PilZ domain-containing protein [Polyangiales bacterium]|nr:PilZ domain-containing protein [Polyangiales bacterium]
MDSALALGADNIADRRAELALGNIPDRRRHPRHDLIGQCWIDAPQLTLLGPTQDIGVGGLFVRTAAQLPLGTTVEVCLRVPGESESLVAEALVARSVPIGLGPPCHGLGLAFVEIARGQGLLRVLLSQSLTLAIELSGV